MTRTNELADLAMGMAKALVAAAATGAATGAMAASDDVITAGEWWTIAAATIGALAAVWSVPNAPKGRHSG